MQITPANLAAIFYGFDTRFQQAFTDAETWSDAIASTIPSAGAENRYAWIGVIPRLREWIGERQLRNLEARGYTLPNKDYEDSFEVDRNHILDDLVGVYAPAVDMLGRAAKMWPDDIIGEALLAGHTNLCFDGQPFFNASHPVKMTEPGLGVFSNYEASAFALNPTNYQAARARMMAFKNEDGKSMRVRPNLLIVPPALELTARQILNADFIANAHGINAATGSSQNVLKGTADLLVVPDLAGQDTTWYLMDTTKAIKPLVFQLREAVKFAQLTDPTSENVFKRKKFVYGCDARGAAGYTLPHLAFKAVG